MRRDEIQAKVSDVVARALHLGAGGVNFAPNTPLTSHGLDSLNIMDILLGIEQAFGITFDDRDLDLSVLETVDSLTDFVVGNLG